MESKTSRTLCTTRSHPPRSIRLSCKLFDIASCPRSEQEPLSQPIPFYLCQRGVTTKVEVPTTVASRDNLFRATPRGVWAWQPEESLWSVVGEAHRNFQQRTLHAFHFYLFKICQAEASTLQFCLNPLRTSIAMTPHPRQTSHHLPICCQGLSTFDATQSCICWFYT